MNQPHPVIAQAIDRLGQGPLTEERLVDHIHPLFSRVLSRNQKTDEIYLANHSLGRPPNLMAEEVGKALDSWYTDLDKAWELWIDARQRYRACHAEIMRWPSADAVVPKTSAAQGLRAVLNAHPNPQLNVVSTRCEFDSIDAVLKAYAHRQRLKIRWVDAGSDDLLDTNDVLGAIDQTTDLVVISAVTFVTGQVIDDLAQIVNRAHNHDALVVIDSYHAFGALPLDFGALAPDFVIGGNYKYTRGGPGAGFMAIHPRHLNDAPGVPDPGKLMPLDTGWFAKDEPFAFNRPDTPHYAAGGDAWLEATPPVLTWFQALPGLELTLGIGVDRLREYSLKQHDHLRARLREHGVTPRQMDNHGAYLLIDVTDGREAADRLKEHGINCDARPCPSSSGWVVRLCPDILNKAEELDEAAARIGHVLATQEA